MSERLRDRLIEQIRARGPITFAAYMHAALYDPADGFFAGAPVGETEHFVTSPHVSPVFGSLLAVQLADAWEALGRPSPFTVVEAGAGDGTLASQIIEAARGTEWAPDLRYVCLEQSPVARGAIGARDLVAAATIDEAAPEPVTGVVLANELFDNLPFHRVRRDGDRVLEVFVDEREGRLVETVADASPDALDAIGAPLQPGLEQPSSPAARATATALARILARGYLIVLDYGFVAGEDPGPVRGYRGQRLVTDLLADPGGSDITGPVDLDALADAARAAHLTAWGPVTQREALGALGYRAMVQKVRARQAELERAGRWREAVSAWNQRGETSMLIDPAGLGSLKVLAVGTAGLRPPLAFRGS
ncbi:MAG TPA: SAM-dependent methyltransferase [Actinomycetota bacterium]